MYSVELIHFRPNYGGFAKDVHTGSVNTEYTSCRGYDEKVVGKIIRKALEEGWADGCQIFRHGIPYHDPLPWIYFGKIVRNEPDGYHILTRNGYSLTLKPGEKVYDPKAGSEIVRVPAIMKQRICSGAAL